LADDHRGEVEKFMFLKRFLIFWGIADGLPAFPAGKKSGDKFPGQRIRTLCVIKE
jgi:hypothetical protein